MEPRATVTPEQGNPSALRLFVAAAAPERIRAAASEATVTLQRLGDVRWVTPERLHLTLKFLGSVPKEKVPEIEEVLRGIANNCLHFAIRLDGIGAFPSTRRPQTVWLGLGGDTAALSTLADRIEAAVEPLGFARERRPFRPHLTLGRVRSSRGLRDLATELEQRATETSAGIAKVEWRIDEIALIRSDLKPTGPVYTELSRFPLATRWPASNGEQE